jgi:hypothetical protein
MPGPRDPANDDGEPDIEREGDDREPGDFEDDQGDRLDEWREQEEREEEAIWNSIL